MTLRRMDNVLIVVDDLEAAKAFFAELRRRLRGIQTRPTTRATVDGRRGEGLVRVTPRDDKVLVAVLVDGERDEDGYGRVDDLGNARRVLRTAMRAT